MHEQPSERNENAFLSLGLLLAALVSFAPAATAGGLQEAEAEAAHGDQALAFDRSGWIYVAAADGTAARRLIRGSGATFSPDGSRLAFSRADHLYVAYADGTGERRLTRAGRGFGVRWSPDGRRLAFTSHYRTGRFAVYVANADGSGVRPLVKPAHAREESSFPAWAPDGGLIAFASTRTHLENPEIYVVRPNGTGLRRLTHTVGDAETLGDDGMPTWSPDGKQIVFTSNRTGTNALWVMRADGTLERKLYDSKRTDELDPQFSPDGRRIAFSRLALANGEVWTVSSDGRNARRVAAGGRPTWLPARRPLAAAAGTRRELVFVRGEGNRRELYTIREDGSGLRRLTNNRAGEAGPVWSPDGTRLLFTSSRDGDDEVFVMDADGRNVRQLTRNRSLDLTPAWSPDGRQIAFASDRARRGEPEIWLMRADGTAARRLIRTANHPTWQDAQFSPTFSPDGRRLIFAMAVAMDNPELHVVGVDGRSLKRLTRTGGTYARYGDDTMPHWSRDGRIVVFVSNRDQRSSDVWVMNADATRQRPVVRFPRTDDWNPRLSADGQRLAFARYPIPDGSATIWLANADGTAARRLVSGSEPDWRP